MSEEFFDDDTTDPVFDDEGLLDESDDPELDYWDDETSAVEMIPCPNCGCEVYEEALQCPACGEYVTHSTHALSGRPWWWIILGLIGIGATIYVLAQV